MKIEPRRIAGFLADPGSCRVVLIYGPDLGLVRERATALVRHVAGALDDPFRVDEVPREQMGRLPMAAAELSMTGGRRVVRAREVTDAWSGAVEETLKGPGEALVVLEAGDLPGRSRLRGLVERHDRAAALPCYVEEGRALEETIAALFRAEGMGADPEAVRFLAGRIGGDHGATRQEVVRIATLAGPGARVTLDLAESAVSGAGDPGVDAAVLAVQSGDVAAADAALETALAEGESVVGILRAMQRGLTRLHALRLAMEAGGMPAAAAVDSARPPIFFRDKPAMTRAVGLWPSARLVAALESLRQAELACKQTGSADAALCRRALLSLAQGAARLSRG